MIRPAAFGFNPETAASNAFQRSDRAPDALERARCEFDRFAKALMTAGVKVEIADDEPIPPKPDAVFPNNWVTFHKGGVAVLYPMASPARRSEVREDLVRKLGYRVVLDLRQHAKGRYLEGTGSMVLDRSHNLAFACESPRTDISLLNEFCLRLGFQPVVFRASLRGLPIYHTNVLLTLGQDLALVCLEVCEEPGVLRTRLEQADKRIVELSPEQLESFAGNMLQLRIGSKDTVWAMSDRAWSALNPDQRKALEEESAIVAADLSTIENVGGGSARCMLAELY
jgi:hypothetical protein